MYQLFLSLNEHRVVFHLAQENRQSQALLWFPQIKYRFSDQENICAFWVLSDNIETKLDKDFWFSRLAAQQPAGGGLIEKLL